MLASTDELHGFLCAPMFIKLPVIIRLYGDDTARNAISR